MNVDWQKIEKELGYKIAFVALGGSRLYGLNHNKSDYDYVCFVFVKNGQEPPSLTPYRLPDYENTDFFLRKIDYNIARWANVWTVPLYSAIIYADERIKNFLEAYKNELPNLNPSSTLKTCQDSVKKALNIEYRSKVATIFREVSVIHRFIDEGNFNKATQPLEEYSKMYHNIKDEETSYDIEEIERKIGWIFDHKTQLFFRQYPFNEKLFNEFCSRLKEIEQTIK